MRQWRDIVILGSDQMILDSSDIAFTILCAAIFFWGTAQTYTMEKWDRPKLRYWEYIGLLVTGRL